MPSLIKFLSVILAIGTLIYGGMWLLVSTYHPETREITSSIPQDKLKNK